MICYDYVNEYIKKTIKKDEGLLLELREYAQENNIPIVQPEVARFMSVMGYLVKPSKILEIGTAIGYSSILLSKTLCPGGIIDSIENNEEMIRIAKNNINMSGCKDVINIIPGDAAEILPYLDKRYDLIFIDAAKGQYPEFLPHCLRMLNNKGLLITDNVLYKGMVTNDDLVVKRKKTIVKRLKEYLNTICNDINLETSILPLGDGVAISFCNREDNNAKD